MTAAITQRIFVGTMGNKTKPGTGIYTTTLDPATGELSAPILAAATPNPGFLTASPDHRLLYALTEFPGSDGNILDGLAAFTMDKANGQLTLLNRRDSGGAGGTTHVAVDTSGKVAVTVSYQGGYVAAFPIMHDGQLGPASSFITQTGPLGPNRRRQDAPHPHSVTLSTDGRFAYVCDLGLDKIFCYQIDPATALLTKVSAASAAPGAGPRHSKLSADGRYLYVINELNGTITTYSRDTVTGGLQPGASVKTLPDDFKGENTCAEIRIHPHGRFVYGSNRGHDSLAVFARDEQTGALTRIQIEPCGGGHPRNFALSPDGNWLVCANRDSNNLVVFKIDPATGKLNPTGHRVTIPSPVCVLFVD